MTIHRQDIGDILNCLPDLTLFNPRGGCNLLVCTLGFEVRCHKILQDLLQDKSNQIDLILVNYPTNKDDNEANRIFFEQSKDDLKSFNEITYNKATFYKEFSTLLSKFAETNSKVLFDVSTCSSYLFYPIFKALLEVDVDITIGYTEAESYFPTISEWEGVEAKAKKENSLFIKSWDEADFQSIGIDEVYNSNLFYDLNPENKSTALVAIPNFNSIRMQAIKGKDYEINKTDADNVIWIIGQPPDIKNHWRVEALIKTNMLELIDSSKIFYASTLQYKETLESLESIWEKFKYKFHISIGSLGSKMQHIGAFFFVYLHPDIGVWFAEPKEFKAKAYSSGIGKQYQIDFGNSRTLTNHLSLYMQFQWKTN